MCWCVLCFQWRCGRIQNVRSKCFGFLCFSVVRQSSKHRSFRAKCFDNLFLPNGAAPVYFWLLARQKILVLPRDPKHCFFAFQTPVLPKQWKYTQIQKQPYKNVLSTNRRGVHYIDCKSKQFFCIPSSCSAQWNTTLQKYKIWSIPFLQIHHIGRNYYFLHSQQQVKCTCTLGLIDATTVSSLPYMHCIFYTWHLVFQSFRMFDGPIDATTVVTFSLSCMHLWGRGVTPSTFF